MNNDSMQELRAKSYLQVREALVQRAARRVRQRDEDGREPADDVEPLEKLVVLDKRHHQNRVQIKSLAEHPKVIRQHEVVHQNVQHLAGQLRAFRNCKKASSSRVVARLV